MYPLRFIGVNKDTKTAGPGRRLEFFTKGCIRGVIAPCEGCFNESTWTFQGVYRETSVSELIEICDAQAWNRQVTFCGGEPMLQARAITQAAKALKNLDPTFHFVMYTAYTMEHLLKHGLSFVWRADRHGEAMRETLSSFAVQERVQAVNEYNQPIRIAFTLLEPSDVLELLSVIDLVVDGDYQHDKRLSTSQTMQEGWFIGSSNQRVIFGPASVLLKEIKYFSSATYFRMLQEKKTCACCGHPVSVLPYDSFCSNACLQREADRKKTMQNFYVEA